MADFKVGQRVRINERNVIGHIADIDDNPTTERSIFVETEFSYTGWYPPEGLSDPAAPPVDTDDDPEITRLSAELDRLRAQLEQIAAERDECKDKLTAAQRVIYALMKTFGINASGYGGSGYIFRRDDFYEIATIVTDSVEGDKK